MSGSYPSDPPPKCKCGATIYVNGVCWQCGEPIPGTIPVGKPCKETP